MMFEFRKYRRMQLAAFSLFFIAQRCREQGTFVPEPYLEALIDAFGSMGADYMEQNEGVWELHGQRLADEIDKGGTAIAAVLLVELEEFRSAHHAWLAIPAQKRRKVLVKRFGEKGAEEMEESHTDAAEGVHRCHAVMKSLRGSGQESQGTGA